VRQQQGWPRRDKGDSQKCHANPFDPRASFHLTNCCWLCLNQEVFRTTIKNCFSQMGVRLDWHQQLLGAAIPHATCLKIKLMRSKHSWTPRNAHLMVLAMVVQQKLPWVQPIRLQSYPLPLEANVPLDKFSSFTGNLEMLATAV
jgi:hypothetical protein